MPRSKWLDEVKKREVCALVTAGMSLAKVARYVGCHARTIRRERQQDEEFDHRLRRAEMAANLNPLEAMRRAAATHWRAAAWMLERQERLEPRPRTSGGHISRDQLVLLADRVKQLVRGAMLDPFKMPLVEQNIEQLFAEVASGSIGSRDAKLPPAGPSLDESLQFLDWRLADRSTDPPEQETEEDEPTADIRNGASYLVRRLREALEKKREKE